MYKRIVIGTDGSETATQALVEAITLASLAGAELHVVSAFEEFRAPGEPGMEAANAVLDAAAAQARDGGVFVRTHARTGGAAEAILDVATEIGADLIVVGNKGMQGSGRFLLGGVSNRISHHAPCAVLIAKTTWGSDP